MRLFKQTPEDYYNAPYAEFPALIRGTVAVVMGILWVFSKLMWRWRSRTPTCCLSARKAAVA